MEGRPSASIASPSLPASSSDSSISNPERSRNYVSASRTYSQNLQHHLWDREHGYNRRNFRHAPAPWNLEYELELTKCITPNLTIQNVSKPSGYLRKFTPDGVFMLSFTHDQRALEVYKYRGVASLATLLQHTRSECITAADPDQNALNVRQNAHEQIFKLTWSIILAPPPPMQQCHLNREFSIFLDGGRFVLLSSVSMAFYQPTYTDIFDYPDMITECDLFAYSFFLIDLKLGRLGDILHFPHDFISLSHNHGVSAHKRTIAVLSKYRQCIDLMQVSDSGKFSKLCVIGPFGWRTPETIDLQRIDIDNMDMPPPVPLPPIRQTGRAPPMPLSHIKQRILAYIYRDILEATAVEVDSSAAEIEDAARRRREKLREFYRSFVLHETMAMSKMQLIDDDNLLIHYEKAHEGDEPQFEGIITDLLYIFYNISSDEILRIFAPNSVELLHVLRNFCDSFRNIRSQQTQRPPSSPNNNVYVRSAFDCSINSVPGGLAEAAQRFNPTLPISTQSFTATLYLDYSLFDYDDRLISVMERPKLTSAQPIQFWDRITCTTKFRLFMETSGDEVSPPNTNSDDCDHGSASKCPALVAFICHPFEPFIVSIQRIGPRFITNFHVYNQATVVQP